MRHVAYDVSDAMVSVAQKKGISITLEDITAAIWTPPMCEVALALFTLQFLSVTERKEVCVKVFSALKPGGMFFVSDKNIFVSPKLQSMCDGILTDYKQMNGITHEACIVKERSLRGVMTDLVTSDEFTSMMKAVGFHVEVIHKDLHFTSWVCMKPVVKE